MGFPITRLRRLRSNDRLRSLVRETRLTRESLVYPIFVCPGRGVRKEVRSMPGVFNLSVDEALKEAQQVEALGIPAVILFGLPEKKDEIASGAWSENGIVQQATRAIKGQVMRLLVIADVCLCEYMSHGHCGVVRTSTDPDSLLAMSGKTPSDFAAAPGKARQREYEIVNDATLEILAKSAVSLARAGVDIVAPSDMMDGRVAAIRTALDAEGYSNTPILSYAAKFASAFYGPFRAAIRRPPLLSNGRSKLA
jgi:porphobilinogen synthase